MFHLIVSTVLRKQIMEIEEPQPHAIQDSSQDGAAGTETLNIPFPPVDWAFNTLLLSIANGMTSNDLNKAKAIFKGLIFNYCKQNL